MQKKISENQNLQERESSMVQLMHKLKHERKYKSEKG